MNKKIEETLKVLVMEEDEQWNFLIARKDIQEMCQNQLDAWCQSEYKRRVLADLAFRLRDELHDVLGSAAWDRACWEVWKYIKILFHSNIFEREHLSIEKREMYCCHWIAFWAKSIELIVTALIAKEILADHNEKFDAHLAEEREPEKTEKDASCIMDSIKYLRLIEWSMGCGGNRNEGQCPECCGPSKKWAEGANKSWMKQFGCKRVEDEDIGHTPECRLGNTLKKSVPIYAIGQDDGEGGYSMWDGPNPSEQDMLDVEGRDNNSVIIRFNVDGTDEVIWRWENEDGWAWTGGKFDGKEC